jgi:hypothetical protein
MTKIGALVAFALAARAAEAQPADLGPHSEDISAHGRLSPMQFGCAGDGRKDDTACIQAAIDAAASRGLPLEFDTAHLFRISSTLVVGGPVALYGPYRYGAWAVNQPTGRGLKACPWGLMTPATGITVLRITAVTATVDGLCIDMTGDGGASNPTAGAAIALAPPRTSDFQADVRIEHNTILFPYDGITVDGAGYNPGCCGVGTTADGNTVNWNTIVSPAHTGISNGRLTASAASSGNTYWDNSIVCDSAASRSRGTGFALYDGDIDYNGTTNGPESCYIGFLVAPGDVGGQPQNVGGNFAGVLGDQSGLYDFVMQPRTPRGVVDFFECINCWAAATGDSSSILIDGATNGGSLQELSFINLNAHGGNGLTRPIVDIRAGAGGPYDLSIIGSNICEFGAATRSAVALRLDIAAPVAGRYVINGNRFGTGCPGRALDTGIALSIRNGASAFLTFVGNDLSSAALPVAYSPAASDQVTFSNNMGLDGGGEYPEYASAPTVALRNADQNISVTGSETITTLANPWTGRRVEMLSRDGFALGPGGDICVSSKLEVPIGQAVIAIWPRGARCWVVH